MSKHHYESIATVLHANRDAANPVCRRRVDLIASDLAYVFAIHNEHFDRERFLTACGADPSA